MGNLEKKIDSSTIESVRYFPDNKELQIKFKNNTMYIYSDVPFKVYMGLIHAPSAGSYLWKNVRNKYETKKI